MNKGLINDKEKDEDNGKENGNSEEMDKMKSVKEFGNTTMTTPDERIQVISIIGQIEGHMVATPQTKSTKYEHIIPQLIAIEQNDKVKGVLIVLNTVGGDVEAGLAISEMINSLSKPTVSLVIGGGHSIGVPLATSSDYSFISPSATMIVHPIRMNGFIIGVAQTFKYFEKMQERINNFIVRTSDISDAELRKFMQQTDELLNDMGTILIGKEAVECKLIDEVGGISQAIKKLDELIASKEEEIQE